MDTGKKFRGTKYQWRSSGFWIYIVSVSQLSRVLLIVLSLDCLLSYRGVSTPRCYFIVYNPWLNVFWFFLDIKTSTKHRCATLCLFLKFLLIEI